MYLCIYIYSYSDTTCLSVIGIFVTLWFIIYSGFIRIRKLRASKFSRVTRMVRCVTHFCVICNFLFYLITDVVYLCVQTLSHYRPCPFVYPGCAGQNAVLARLEVFSGNAHGTTRHGPLLRHSLLIFLTHFIRNSLIHHSFRVHPYPEFRVDPIVDALYKYLNPGCASQDAILARFKDFSRDGHGGARQSPLLRHILSIF